MTIRTFTTVTITLAAVFALAACTGSAETGQPDEATPSSTGSLHTDADFNEADAMFAEMMIPHHEQAVEMSDIVLEKEDVDQRVIDLAVAIKDAQGPEIEILEGWLSEWGVEPSSDGSAHAGHDDGMMSGDDIIALEESTGIDTSRLFLEQMIIHHEGAVEMAETQLDEGQNAEALELAQVIIDAQTTEIELMREILAGL